MNKPTKLALSLVCVSVLSACSFDDDKPSPAPVVDTPPAPPPTYLLSGTVTGLNGELSVTAGEEEVTVTEDGAIAFTTEFNSGDSVTASISAAPELQECAITSDTEFTFDDADIDALAVECRDLELYAAVADSAETADDAAVTIDVLANDTSEYAETFELLEVTEPANGTAAISENKITYTPTEGFAGTDTFSYTGTDGAQEASAEVTVTISQTVSIAGRVTDAPLANATVTLTINGETYTATTNEDGDYVLDLSMTDLSSNSRPRLSATGAGEQSYITLSSRLPSILAMLDAAGEDRTLERSESNKVQVTQLSTAENILLENLAAGDEISDENFQLLLTELDGDLLLEIAGVIKLLADNPDYQLPEGHDNIESFLADTEAYNQFAEEAEATGDLQQAIDETISDPEVTEPAAESLADIAGVYLPSSIGSRYSGRNISAYYVVTADGIAESTDPVRSFTQRGDGFWVSGIKRPTEFVFFYNDLASSTGENAINLQMDTETATALEAYMAGDYLPFPVLMTDMAFKVLAETEESLTVLQTTEFMFNEYTFTWEGVTYTIDEQYLSFPGVAVTWNKLEGLKSGQEFVITDGSQWLVPQLLPDVDFETGALLEPSLVHQIVSLTVDTETSGRFVNALTGDEGTWELTDNKTSLVLTNAIDGEAYHVTLNYARKDEHVSELVATMDFGNIEPLNNGKYRLTRGGLIDSELSVDELFHEEGQLNLALLNFTAAQFDGSTPILAGDLFSVYGWEFTPTGEAEMRYAECAELSFDPYAIDAYCAEEDVYWPTGRVSTDRWSVQDNQLQIWREFVSTPGCTNDLSCGGRFEIPVRMNGETGIRTIVEFETVGAGSTYGEYYPGYGEFAPSEIMQRPGLEPRINYWLPIDKALPPSGTAAYQKTRDVKRLRTAPPVKH